MVIDKAFFKRIGGIFQRNIVQIINDVKIKMFKRRLSAYADSPSGEHIAEIQKIV